LVNALRGMSKVLLGSSTIAPKVAGLPFRLSPGRRKHAVERVHAKGNEGFSQRSDDFHGSSNTDQGSPDGGKRNEQASLRIKIDGSGGRWKTPEGTVFPYETRGRS